MMDSARGKILADFQNLVEPLAKEKGATTFGSVKYYQNHDHSTIIIRKNGIIWEIPYFL